MKKDLNFEELARRRYPKATKEEMERIVAKWKAKAKKMAAEPTISLIEFGWVPSDDKNWMPVKLRAMKKTLNIEEQKVRMVKVKKPRFDMGGLVDNPTMPKRGKWLSASTMVDVKDSNPLTSDEPMFSPSTW